jgi:hypothetical protein
MSKAITRCSPTRVLIRVDLPTFGRPTMAILMARLQRHFVHDAFLGDRFETTRIDDQEWAVADPAFAVVAVAGETREVGHERVARTGQAIE